MPRKITGCRFNMIITVWRSVRSPLLPLMLALLLLAAPGRSATLAQDEPDCAESLLRSWVMAGETCLTARVAALPLSILLIGEMTLRDVSAAGFPAWHSLLVQTAPARPLCSAAPGNALVLQSLSESSGVNLVVNGVSLQLRGTLVVRTARGADAVHRAGRGGACAGARPGGRAA